MGMPPTPSPPPPPAVITKNVTIAPATTFSITSGLNTATPLMGGSVVIKFKVKAGTTDGGQYLMGILAQEKITNKASLSPPFFPAFPPDDVDWTPNAPDPAFQLVGNVIEDTKAMNGFMITDPDWVATPNGATFYTATQYLRLKYVDPCGTTKYISLGSVVLKRVKVDAQNWKIVVGP